MMHYRYAFRTLRKNAGFSLIVVTVLGLGIGGTVAIFSIVNAALLKPLPYEQPERLVELWGNIQRARVERRGSSLLDYRDWKQQNRSFEGLASFWDAPFTWTTAEERVLVRSEVVGSEYFRLLGLKPVLGRDFLPEEEMDAALPPVVVLGHQFWEQRFGSDPSVLGRKLILDSMGYTVVGVMPRGFRGLGDTAEIWVPHASLPPRLQSFTDRGTRGMLVVGRLRPTVRVAQTQAEMDTISRALELAYRDTNDKRGVEVSPLVKETFGSIRPALLVLLGAVSMVLAIAFANVANLMLLRAERRHSEIAIRTAIGASRWDLLKVTLAETSILSFAGSALGLFVSIWAVDLILTISPTQLPSFVQVGVDRNVIGFAIAVALLIALLMAIAPALQFAPANLHDRLSSNSTRTTAARSTKHFRNALIIGEVALSFVLLSRRLKS
jgi:predicted permease